MVWVPEEVGTVLDSHRLSPRVVVLGSTPSGSTPKYSSSGARVLQEKNPVLFDTYFGRGYQLDL
jgi:hypothetical protein